MFALISENELVFVNKIAVGKRIAEVSSVKFPVALPLYWISVTDAVVADRYYWDGENAVLIPTPTKATIKK